MSEKRRGRPTIAEQIEIKNDIRECLLQDIEDPKTIQALTGYDIKTVRYYMKKLKAQENSDDASFLEKTKEQKQKAILRFKHQISKLEKMSRFIEDKIKQNNEPPTKGFVQLVKLSLDIEKMITALTLYLTNMGNSPTADVSLATKTDDLMKHYGIVLPQ